MRERRFFVCKSKRLVDGGWEKPEKVDRVVSIWEAKMRLLLLKMQVLARF